MTGQRTAVDVLSLEDFHRTLAARLAEAEAALGKLDTQLQCRPPALGTFADATARAARYNEMLRQHGDRLRRLKVALAAAHDATGTIIANYRTTEGRNRANAADIAAVLGAAGAALQGNGADDA